MPNSAEYYLEKLYGTKKDGSIRVLDFPHYEIHEGETFSISYKSVDGSDVADNGYINLLLVCGSKDCHTIFRMAAGGDAELFIYEQPSTSANGTALSVVNKNRSSDNSPLAVAYAAPTVTGTGFNMFNPFIPGGTGGTSAGSESDHTDEWIFARNKRYLFRLYNRSGNAQPLGMIVEFYEHNSY